VKEKTIMTKQELDSMYSNALKGDSTTMIRLFGIKYAEELKKM